jgi:hypothetical protein
MKWPARAFRRLLAGGLVAATLPLASCSMTLQAVEAPATTSTSVSAAVAGPSTPTDTPTPESTATPTETPTPEPTATATESPTPDQTATAGAAISAQWSTSAQQILQIDRTLTAIGTAFQGGTLNSADAGSQVRQLDQRAGAIDQTVDRLPPLPGVDGTTLTHYRQTVDQWAAALRDLDAKVAANDIFQAPGAVNHLEQIAGDLEQQTANLHLAK